MLYDTKLEGDEAVIVHMAMEYLVEKPTEYLDADSKETLLAIGEFLMHPSPATKVAAVEAADQYFRSFAPCDSDQDTPVFGMQPICSACLGTGYVEAWQSESTRCHWCNGTGFAAAGGGGGDDGVAALIQLLTERGIVVHTLDQVWTNAEALLKRDFELGEFLKAGWSPLNMTVFGDEDWTERVVTLRAPQEPHPMYKNPGGGGGAGDDYKPSFRMTAAEAREYAAEMQGRLQKMIDDLNLIPGVKASGTVSVEIEVIEDQAAIHTYDDSTEPRVVQCPSCYSTDVEYLGIEDGAGNYGEAVCDHYRCERCGVDFHDGCYGQDG